MSRDPVFIGRCLAVWTSTTLATGLLLAWLLPHAVGVVSSPASVERFEEGLVVGCEATAVLGAGWLWLLVSLVTLEAAGAAPRRHRAVPAGVRRAVLATCGAGLAAGLVTPAHASVPPSPLDGLPLPDRPATVAPSGPAGDDTHPAPTAESRAAGGRPARTVRVDPGDSLWAIAAADLPDGASDAQVDERWRAIHAANREVIGQDPDLLRPGQQLRLPPSVQSPPST